MLLQVPPTARGSGATAAQWPTTMTPTWAISMVAQPFVVFESLFIFNLNSYIVIDFKLFLII